MIGIELLSRFPLPYFFTHLCFVTFVLFLTIWRLSWKSLFFSPGSFRASPLYFLWFDFVHPHSCSNHFSWLSSVTYWVRFVCSISLYKIFFISYFLYTIFLKDSMLVFFGCYCLLSILEPKVTIGGAVLLNISLFISEIPFSL